MVNSHNFEAVRRAANQKRTWAAIALILGWTLMYGIAELASPGQPMSSSGYWPDSATALVIPYQGVRWQAVDRNEAVALPKEQMVLLGEHNGVKFYAHPADQLGGGGGRAQASFQRIYAEMPDGRFIPMLRRDATPDDGRFLPRNSDQ